MFLAILDMRDESIGIVIHGCKTIFDYGLKRVSIEQCKVNSEGQDSWKLEHVKFSYLFH